MGSGFNQRNIKKSFEGIVVFECQDLFALVVWLYTFMVDGREKVVSNDGLEFCSKIQKQLLPLFPKDLLLF